ncbi:MAG TPA: glycosyltransferase [Solirubrobacteraceae bacterium]
MRTHTPEVAAIVEVASDTASVNRVLEQLAPSDVVLIDRPCRVASGWLERLSAAADSDTNVASASVPSLAGTELALEPSRPRDRRGEQEFAELAAGVAERSHSLHPRLSRIVGPCVYIRRDALELVGSFDERLELRAAAEIDFAERCVLAGLTHIVADDLVVELLEGGNADAVATDATLLERYPYLPDTPLADSATVTYALQSVRERQTRLDVTFDARALDGAVTGTHVHVLELIRALARTNELSLRVLIRADRIDAGTRSVLGELSHTELLAMEDVDAATPRTDVFHRPQQTFSPSDVGVALALGERFVISQLDLIAYRNPGYFDEAATWGDYRAASRHGLSAAERVVVFSEHTHDELIADALVEDSRIRVVPPGLDHRAPSEPRRPAALGAQAPLPGFLLCLGTDFRHKNRVFALRLLRALRDCHGWDGSLVLAGAHISPGSSLELERAYLEEHPELKAAVISLGPVDEPEKGWLLENAGAVVYPSVYEGFGLVPFESAIAGVPCLFAPYASLAEAAPDGTATIVPWDPIASAAAAHDLLTNEASRDRHVQSLAERARTLTWDATAAATVAIYREAALAPVRDSATLSRDLVKREARLSVQHDAEVRRLLGEREHAKRMYDELNAKVGFGLGLIGPNGSLPENVQRALLAVSARPALSRPLFGALSGVFVLVRAGLRPIRMLARPRR